MNLKEKIASGIREGLIKDFKKLYVREYTTTWEMERVCRATEIGIMSLDNTVKSVIAILKAENEALKEKQEAVEKELARMKQLTWCAYCGKEYPLDTTTAEQIGEHIATCEKHPLYHAQQRIKELEATVMAMAIGKLQRGEPPHGEQLKETDK